MMMLRILFVSLFFFSAAFASSSQDLGALLNTLHTMKADFTQTVYDNRGKVIQTSYGRMALQRPGKFRWEITKPMPQLIVANETRLWIYDRDLEQVTIRALHQAAGDSPAELLSHENATIDKDYAVAMLPNKSANTKAFSLAPRSQDSMLESIQMIFLNGQLSEMRLQDHLGHTTKIQFQHTQMNTSLSSSLFVFNTPPHVDVIDETKRH